VSGAQVGEAAATTPGKRSLAMEAFATALRAIPTTICDNAGARGTAVWSVTMCVWSIIVLHLVGSQLRPYPCVHAGSSALHMACMAQGKTALQAKATLTAVRSMCGR